VTIKIKLKLIVAILIFSCGSRVIAQSSTSDVDERLAQDKSEESTKLTDAAKVVIEWATFFDTFSNSKTEISVDQKFACKIAADTKICEITTEPGKREITLNTNLDFGTFTEKYDFEAGKRYKIEIILNKKNFLVDSLFFGIPVSAMFNEKGKNASLKFELVNVSDDHQK
jgi:hypothetical protein